jgi:hypothetical protein
MPENWYTRDTAFVGYAQAWIPAFAGMTVFSNFPMTQVKKGAWHLFLIRHSGRCASADPESMPEHWYTRDTAFVGYAQAWIPAFAGMTVFSNFPMTQVKKGAWHQFPGRVLRRGL